MAGKDGVKEEDIRRLAENVWSTVLGMDLGASEAELAAGTPTVVGSVGLVGEFDGSFEVRVTEATARRAAAAMFAMDPSELADSDVRDAIGELANIAGGNLKAILGDGCALTMPTVEKGEWAPPSGDEQTVTVHGVENERVQHVFRGPKS
jgi:chemotaxis protein CheX